MVLKHTMGYVQLRHSQHTKTDLRFIIIEADKNLGGCVLLRDIYIQRAISEHISNSAVYCRLSKHEATIHQNKLQQKSGTSCAPGDPTVS